MGAGLDKLSINTSSVNLLQDLSGFALKGTIQTKNSRFLKALECVNQEGRVLVKVYARRGEPFDTLQKEKVRLEGLAGTFALVKSSNLMPFSRVIVTERAAFLVRQYFAHNLCERLGTRPFLSNIEKRWILFQLLKALNQCHHWGIAHGDVTTENVLLTSSNWAYLSDYSPFKPAYLPLEDPSDFTFFYNSSGRTAYIAPERFYSTSGVKPEYLSCSELPPSADMFSFGCVAAELFLPSERPLFDFSQLMAFRKGEYSVDDVIMTIEDSWIQELVRRCTYLDPKKRISIGEALALWPDKIFPHFHDYCSLYLNSADPDERVKRVAKDLGQLVTLVEHPEAPFPAEWSSALQNVRETVDLRHSVRTVEEVGKESCRSADLSVGFVVGALAEAHTLLELPPARNGARASLSSSSSGSQKLVSSPFGPLSPSPSDSPSFLSRSLSSLRLSSGPEDSYERRDLTSTPGPLVQLNEAMIVLLPVITSSIRNVKTPSTKVMALRLLERFARFLDDDVRLQRIVPFIFAVLPHSDDKPLIRARVIRALEQVLSLMTVGEAAVFQTYIIPRIAPFSRDPDETVREVLASCLASLTTSARRLSETVLSSDQGFDGALHELRKLFHSLVRDLLEDNSMAVKRRILMSLTPLCLFFGRRVSTETFVPFVLTFLSHSQWQLRVAAYHHLLGVMSIVGAKSLEDITLALISKSFADPEESVMDRALQCVVSLVQAGLLRKKVVFDLLTLAAPLLIHPSKWIRSSALLLQETVWQFLSPADRFVFFCPAVDPFLINCVSPLASASALAPLVKAHVLRQELIAALAVVHELYRKSHRVGSPDYLTLLQNRLKMSRMSDAAAVRVSLMAGWMQSHAEGNMAKIQEAEAAAAAAAAELAAGKKVSPQSSGPQLLLESNSTTASTGLLETSGITSVGGRGGGDRDGTIEKPIVLANVNVVAIEKKPLEEESSGSARYSDDEWKRRFAHISLKQLGAPAASISLSLALDASASGAEGNVGPGSKAVTTGGAMEGSAASPAGSVQSGVVVGGGDNSVVLNLSIGENLEDGAGGSMDPGNPNGSSFNSNVGVYGGAGSSRYNAWRPKGTLVAHLHEHTASVSQISVADDHRFFVSGSLDGTVKVWDCERLHTIVTNRSRLTCRLQKGQINSVTTIKNTHSVASACDMGTVHIFSIEHQRRSEKSFSKTIYTGVQTVKLLDNNEGSIFDVRNFEPSSSSSILMYATSHGNVHGWDLRMKNASKESFLMRNPPRLGLLKAIAVDSSSNWIVVGSDLGIYTIWDLRFQIPVRSFVHPTDSAVVSMSAFGRHSILSSNSDNMVSLWDVEANVARNVFRMLKPKEATVEGVAPPPLRNLQGYLQPRTLSSEDRLISLPPVALDVLDATAKKSSSSMFLRPRSSTNSLDAMLKSPESMSDLSDLNSVAGELPREQNAVRALLSPPDCSWIVTGSTDCRIRFWDLARASDSYTISGLPKNQKAQYASEVQEGVSITQEQVEIANLRTGGVRSANAGLATASTGHRDAVTDLAVVHSSSPMIVSSDRTGAIKVFL